MAPSIHSIGTSPAPTIKTSTRRPLGDRGQRLGSTEAKSPSSTSWRQGEGAPTVLTAAPHPPSVSVQREREGRTPVEPTAHGLRARVGTDQGIHAPGLASAGQSRSQTTTTRLSISQGWPRAD
eukprot:4146674-Pleurochrysis_carterae.AAC.1